MFHMRNDSGVCPSPTSELQTFTSALQFFAAAQCVITQEQDWPPDAAVERVAVSLKTPYRGLLEFIWEAIYQSHSRTKSPQVTRAFRGDRKERFISSLGDGEHFDFIIVGGGTAGCVLANRLSEVKEWKVLLIEAGGDPPVESIIPNLSATLLDSRYDWQYRTVDNGRTNQANINNSVDWPRGKMLGGSSGINGMIYVRGRSADYKQWYDDGNEEWHPDIVRQYFKKAENLQNGRLLKDSSIGNNYGHNGPQIINKFNFTYRGLTEKVLEAWNEIGFDNVPDLNTNPKLGSGIITATAANGERRSSATSYLRPIKNRQNLKVIKYSLVSKILINNSTKEAYGVIVSRNHKKITLFAAREVILSAGTINTPQLLMLSGIGCQKHLTSKKIRCKVNLPSVGQNLQDHIIIPVTIYGNEPGLTNEEQQKFETIQYLYNRTGYLAQSSLCDILAFYSLDKNASFPKFQNHLIIFWRNSNKTRMWAQSRMKYKPAVVDSMVRQNVEKGLYIFMFNLLHPYSRGNISLNSANPRDHPLINPNYFDDPRDLEDAVKGIKMLTKIVNTTYFQSIDGYLGRINWPACDVYEVDSDDYWRCICINMVITVYHPVGTAKMGTDPKTSVVDSRLRVHGVRNLRVIDASVMPTITSGNTNGPTTMIGERGADLIKEDHDKI